MTKPEIIGSIRSTYTRAVCMVCEEKGIEYVPTERPLHAPEISASGATAAGVCSGTGRTSGVGNSVLDEFEATAGISNELAVISIWVFGEGG